MASSRGASPLTALAEGIGIALDSLRASKGRAALTILGVAIGVAVVMAMAAAVKGINSSIETVIESTGPKTFFVLRYFAGGLLMGGGGDENAPWLRNPPLTGEEAELLRRLPSINAVVVAEDGIAIVEAGQEEEDNVTIGGRGALWPQVAGGEMTIGRSFTAVEEGAGARVGVLSEKLADRLFSRTNPVGKRIKVGGETYLVLGVWVPPPNLFGGSGQNFVVIPWLTFHRYMRKVPWGNTEFLVLPTDEATLTGAIDDVTAALRRARGLRPRQENSFAVVTQEKAMEVWGNLTGVFFVVMIALSGVGLMVGGVGVVAVMMISVTERTREIGVRKALGATRGEILWQFLVEAATLTAIGGAFGMALGGALAYGIAHLTPVPARVPPLSIVAALIVSVLTGIVFGIVPAQRAAKMDPVEALRYE